MAHIITNLRGDFSTILSDIEDAILDGSATASCEGTADFTTEHCRCATRIYERFSYTGSNRVSLSLTLIEADGVIRLHAFTSGGSQAMFFKLNTLGESAFLRTIEDVVQRYAV